MASDFFQRQLASYAAVHRDLRNRATHFVGIPVIVFSLLLVLSLWRPSLAGHDVSGALVVAVLGPGSTWGAFLVLFVGGWVLPFLGHHYEGKRPALADNIFQAFIGPIFLVAETMVALGQRRDLANLVHQVDVTAR